MPEKSKNIAKDGISIFDGAVDTRDRSKDVVGTAVAEGRSSLIKIGDIDPQLQEVVDEFNRKVSEAYAILEQTGVVKVPMPVARVLLIHVSQVVANDYNPNSVANQEMRLLHTSISSDGYTQPIVSIWDPNARPAACTCGKTEDGEFHLPGCDTRTKPAGRYVIVDGFHRFTTMRRFQDIADSTSGYLPVVVLDKSPADRIASTVRHNRARGKHSVAGMGNLVFQMLEAGEDEATICQKLGLDAEELLRLKHVTGYSKLYADRTTGYSTAVLTGSQVKAKAEYKKEHPDEPILPY